MYCFSYQAEDGAGPSIAQQLEMKPFASVIQLDTLKQAYNGHGLVAVHSECSLVMKK